VEKRSGELKNQHLSERKAMTERDHRLFEKDVKRGKTDERGWKKDEISGGERRRQLSFRYQRKGVGMLIKHWMGG